MLSLGLNPGEYLMIGENVVVQYNCTKGSLCRLAVEAPKDVSLLRGQVYEKNGGKRPACLTDVPRVTNKTMQWNQNKAQALGIIRKTLRQMEQTEETETIRKYLNEIFPEKETVL